MPRGTHLYTGKVKVVYWETEPKDTDFGRGYMDMGRNVFSVFDYGKKQPMPFDIEGKNEALYMEALRMFEVLEDAGIPTHFIEDMGKYKIRIKLARMLEYDEIEPGKTIIYRVPMECVFSKVITPPSSAHGRIRKKIDPPEEYGADHIPEPDEFLFLQEIATSFSTKIEAADTYKGLKSLAKAGGLIGDEADELDKQTRVAGEALIKDAEEAGIILADGKFEFLLGPNRELIVGDSGYSWDECRMLFQLPGGRWVDLSKQFPRNVYAIMGWKSEMNAAKKNYPDNPKKWPDPPEIDNKVKKLIIDTCSVTKHATCRIPGGPGLEKTAKRVADTLDRLKEMYHRNETGAKI